MFIYNEVNEAYFYYDASILGKIQGNQTFIGTWVKLKVQKVTG